MRTMRIYIAETMSGLPDFNYPALDQAEGALLGSGYDAASPAVLAYRSTSDSSAPAEGLRYEDVLARSLERLLSADAVAHLEGWKESPGARIEVSLAHLRGITSAPVEHWVSIVEKKDEQAAARHVPAVSVAQWHLGLIATAADSPERRRRLAERERAASSILVDTLATPVSLRERLMKLGSGARLGATPETGSPSPAPRRLRTEEYTAITAIHAAKLSTKFSRLRAAARPL